MPAEIVPQVVGQAALAAGHAAARKRGAAHRLERLVDRRDDVGDAGPGRRLGQAIAAAGTAHALDQPAAAQAGEQLFEIRQGDVLALSDVVERDRLLSAPLGEVGHGHDRIAALGAQTHGLVSPAEIARIRNGLCYKPRLRARGGPQGSGLRGRI
jgi:hypothetical protein